MTVQAFALEKIASLSSGRVIWDVYHSMDSVEEKMGGAITEQWELTAERIHTPTTTAPVSAVVAGFGDALDSQAYHRCLNSTCNACFS